MELAARLKAFAREELGFDLVGITSAAPLPGGKHLARWVEAGFHSTMHYMAQTAALRADPCALLPGSPSPHFVVLTRLPVQLDIGLEHHLTPDLPASPPPTLYPFPPPLLRTPPDGELDSGGSAEAQRYGVGHEKSQQQATGAHRHVLSQHIPFVLHTAYAPCDTHTCQPLPQDWGWASG